MPVLRLTQHEEKENHYHVEIAFEDDDGSRLTADPHFEFELEQQDRFDLRWYLEDYLQYPMDPAPEIAARVEKRIAELGKELFRLVFEVDDDAREMLPSLRTKLDDTRVEVVTDVKGATALPWELLKDSRTDAWMTVRAKAFVRGYSKPVQKAYLPKSEDKIRILLVICRPGGREDVPFRSVAGKIVKGMDEDARQAFELDVLRPPTFEQLSKVLREAKAEGKPYHIVHFDGHGGYVDLAKVKAAEVLRGLMPVLLGAPRTGEHGYLLFENLAKDDNIEWVDGPSLGKLLVETDTPVLVLNACRSAHAEPQEKPETTVKDKTHEQVRAFGSLAQEVMDAGVAGVVAMRYNVYVVTAAQFVADLYAALASGQTLGEAVSMGRKQLAAQPLREIAFEPRPLQDWSVPVVYEAAPIKLLAGVGAHAPAPIKIDLSQTTKADDGLPRPDIGFFGRDGTILALDRAFDTQQIVLLHAYAGSGKTMTAAEFARWYRDTGGLDGPVLFTSFEQYKPLPRVLDMVEQTFRPIFEQNNIQWLAMSDEDRLNITLQIFKKIPVLWIWDNIEPINGFPSGTASAWTETEQRELRTFMQIVTGQSKAIFLLTSRRDEQKWLGDLPARVALSPMPMQEMVQLARALAERQGCKMSDVEDWMPLLKFMQGNPMTLTVLVGQALRDGLKTKAQIYEYVNKLRTGEAKFDDEASEGRAKSLGASLAYGFESAFTEDERKVLALLHFFQGFVFVETLRIMVNPQNGDWGLGMKHFTSQYGMELLDKASEIGLLTSHGGGYYTIHPALPWFFRGLFEQYYPLASDSPLPLGEGPGVRALRAFVESMGELSNYYHAQYEYGNREVIAPLRAEEPNLLHARTLARKYGWYGRIISTMQGLDTLYAHTGRRLEWKRLVEEILPDFVGADDLPLPGREEQWSLVAQYRVLLAKEARDWNSAERLQRLRVDWNRRRTVSLLARPPETLTNNEKNTIRTLAASLNILADILINQNSPECTKPNIEAFEMLIKTKDEVTAAIAAYNLGHAYMQLPSLRNLDEAERWYRRSLELRADGDRLSHAKCYSQLGLIEHKKYEEARTAKQPDEKLLAHLNAAIKWYNLALENDPPDMPEDLAIDHNQLGNIYDDAGDIERALYHYNESIHYKEMAGNLYTAGSTRRNIAITLANNGRLSDALLYARAALRNFEPYAQGAAQDIQDTQRLIGQIEAAIAKGKK